MADAPTCGLCGHRMGFATCGYASAWKYGDWGEEFPRPDRVDLCHAEDHDCYVRWTVYGERP